MLASLGLALLTASAGWTQPDPTSTQSERVAKALQGMEWRNIGPFRGGRSNAVAGVPQQPRTFFFGGVGSGVWKTTDAGETWVNVSDDTFGTASVGAIAVAPSAPNVVYVGMGEHAVRGVMTSHGDGVYRSDDGGRTWRHLGLERTRQISAVRIHPRDPETVWVAAQGAPYGPTEDRGIYKSVDGGETWEQVLFVGDTAGASGLSMEPGNPRVLYAAFWDHLRLPWQIRSGGPGSGIYKSIDGGSTWDRIGEVEAGGLPAVKGKTSVAVAAGGQRIYALIEADPGGGLYRSEDAGESWTLVNDDWGIRARAWYYIKVYADPQDPNQVWITNAQLYKSIDGGKSFQTVRVPHGDNHDLWISPDDSLTLINANDGGANVSYNGGASWSTQRNQPTAQLYRVITDNQFPYHVYAGQQDNSALGIKSEAPGGIGWGDFYPISGCESASPAFDPDDPTLVYAGCYMGILGEWNRATGTQRDVMAVPGMPASIPPREMRYRFNWNAPLIASPHDPTVLYHGAQQLLRTTDAGTSWTEVSPDLTRDDEEKQGLGGAPITNEGAGGETYGTIYAVAASEHDASTLWAGTDDGLVHVTRDGGASWSDVTPPDIGEAMVNDLNLSPHEPGVAYVAVTRYKFNDFTPLAYKTDDFGASWTFIADGIPEEAWVRVVIEDPRRRGLLYMGTELGVFVSFDDGASWHDLDLNLPVSAITDLTIQRQQNDLVASTAGRSFWILDQLEPLQQLNAEVLDAAHHLFAPGPAYRTGSGGFFLPGGRVGENPPGATVFDVLLPEDGADVVHLVVRDGSENEVRRFEGKRKKKGVARVAVGEEPPPAEDVADEEGEAVDAKRSNGAKAADSPFSKAADAVLTKFEFEAGGNRIGWNGRHRQIQPLPGHYAFGGLSGRRAIPGDYTVALEIDEVEVARQSFEVLPDPRLRATQAQYEEQEEFVAHVDGTLEALYAAVFELRHVRSQIESFTANRAAILDRDNAETDELADEAATLVEALGEVEEELVQKRTVDGQTVINFRSKLDLALGSMRSNIDSQDGAVTNGARARFAELEARWLEQKERLDAVLGAQLDDLNARIAAEGLGPLLRGPQRP